MPILKYDLEKSELYKLSRKSRLKELLNIDSKELKYCSNAKNLEVEYDPFINEKGRPVDNPLPYLKSIHKKLNRFLGRIKYPPYLYSAKKRCGVKNAKQHKNNDYMLKMDINKFFPSTNIEYVFTSFKYNFKMSDDVAWILSNIVCYKGHLATGSPVSSILSFWAYKNTFDNINMLAKARCIKMSLYVDDMAFSSKKKIPLSFKNKIENRLNKVKLELSKKEGKVVFYSKEAPKFLTGVMIDTDKNLKIMPIKNGLIQMKFGNINNLDKKELFGLRGLLMYKLQIEPDSIEAQEQLCHINRKLETLKSKQ